MKILEKYHFKCDNLDDCFNNVIKYKRTFWKHLKRF